MTKKGKYATLAKSMRPQRRNRIVNMTLKLLEKEKAKKRNNK